LFLGAISNPNITIIQWKNNIQAFFYSGMATRFIFLGLMQIFKTCHPDDSFWKN
jgi:hypothetical protein